MARTGADGGEACRNSVRKRWRCGTSREGGYGFNAIFGAHQCPTVLIETPDTVLIGSYLDEMRVSLRTGQRKYGCALLFADLHILTEKLVVSGEPLRAERITAIASSALAAT